MTEKKDTSSQEIDLIELFTRMGNGISNGIEKLFSKLYFIVEKLAVYLFIASKATLKFGIRNAPLIIGFGILGYLYGSYNVTSSEPFYRTDASIQTFTISSADLIDYTNKLNNISGDSIALSTTLELSLEEAASIKNIEAFWLIDKNKDGVADEIDYANSFIPDTVSNWEKIGNKLYVQLNVSNPEHINAIQDSYEKYLHTFPRMDQITAIKKQSIKSKIERLDNEIILLDSLKRYEYFEKNQMQNNTNVIPLNKILLQTDNTKTEETRLLHGVTLDLQAQSIAQKANLELETEPFRFITKFVTVSKPVDINQEYNLKPKYTVYFLILGIMFSILLKFRKDIFQFIKE